MADWNPKANELFLRAAEIESADERRAFLESQCRDNAALRGQVESLLVASGKLEGFLEQPAMQLATDATGAYQAAEGVGSRIGQYKILQQIGEGGFGVVYMAEQQEPVRRMVALKIIKPGMDTREVIARFESERQALAIMDHPNIARVLDAGSTESGRPYFVMELVKGIPITEFCDKNHMPAVERLKLFTSVCNAIQHAHHKGVIHRDIKPSNVLVTLHDGIPVPKVIDFGVAKATAQRLTEKTLFTAYGQMIGTPAYMSPEQAEMSGLDIDTRSDIYSLGVLLYELLTGTTPIDSKRLRTAGYMEMQRLIREQEAQRPSTRLSSLGGEATVLAGNRGTDPKKLVQMLSGDLDWIVMKALEKDRNRRYASPGMFADDIGRYLRGDAIEARSPTPLYRLQKFVRRNRPVVYGLSAFLILVGLGLYGTGSGMFRALEAEQRAREDAVRARDAEKLAESRLIDVERERDEANKAKALAQRNAGLLQESVALEDSRRLAANSAAIRSTNPGLALLLALRSAEKTPSRSASTNDALMASVRESREEKTIFSEAYQTPEGRAGRAEFQHIAVTPNGAYAIVVPRRYHDLSGDFYTNRANDDSAQVYDLATGGIVARMKLAGLPFTTMAVSPDGSTLAAATDQGAIVRYQDGKTAAYTESTIRFWDIRSGKELKVLKGHTDRITSLCFDSKGDRLLSASYDKTACVWNARTGELLHKLDGGSRSLLCAEFSPDGKRIVTVSTGDLRQGSSSPEVAIRNQGMRERVTLQELSIDPMSRTDSAIRWLAPLGGMMVTSSNVDFPRLWDASNGKLIGMLSTAKKTTSYSDDFAMAAFTPDGRRVVTLGFKSPQVWNAEDGKLVPDAKESGKSKDREVRDGDAIYRLLLENPGAYSDTARLLIWQSDASRTDWRRHPLAARIQRGVSRNDRGMTIFADVSTEGKPLITRVIGNTMSVTDPITGKQTAKLLGHEGQIVAAVFLPHQRIVSASLDGTLRVWNLMANHDPVMELKSVSGDLAGAAYFAASGKLVVTAPKRDQYMNFDNNGIAIWDAASGKHIRAMADEASRATSPLMKELIGDLCDVDISPDGERMATVHVDYNPGSGRDEEEPKPSPNYTPVRVWNTQSGKLLFALSGYRRGVRTARFSPDGNRLLTFADGGRRYAVIRDGKRYAAGSGGQMQAKVDVWDAQTGAHVRNIVPETAGGGHFALWTPDGKRILTNALYHVHNVAADIYDADTGARVAQLKHDLGSMDRATFSADGKLLLGRRNNILKGQLQVDIWETETGTKRTSLRGHTGEITSAHFSPDGKSAITTSMDGTARIWNVATGETVRHLRGHRHSVVSGRYSPDGKWVVTASTDGTAKVWDARTGVEWMSLAVPQAEMHGAEFDKDSQSVLTISSDGVARIWPLDPWPLAKSRKPRELSAEEKAQFHVD